MALASSGFVVTITLQGIAGKPQVQKYTLTAADVATAETDAVTLVTRLNAISDAAILGYTVSHEYKDSAAGFGTKQLSNGALITADLVTAGKSVNLKIPAAADGIFKGANGADYNRVDIADVDMQTFLSSFEAGGIASVSDGEFIRDSATPGNWHGIRRDVGGTDPK